MIVSKVKCQKDLSDLDGQMFTKGRVYSGRQAYVIENLTVINDAGGEHTIGCWAKHFKIV